MGQLKVQLINNFLGPLVLESDPIEINQLTKSIRRSSEGAGVFYEVILDLSFIKAGRDYIKTVFENYGGIDAELFVNLYIRNTDQRKWKLWTPGKVNFNKYDVSEDSISVMIEQRGILRLVTNLMEKAVDIETSESENETALTPLVPLSIPYHSKKLLLQFRAEGAEDEFDIAQAASLGLDPFLYIQFPLEATFDEIAVRQDYPLGYSQEVPMDIKKYNWRVDVGGEYSINIPQLTALISAGNVDGAEDWTFKFYISYGRGISYTTVEIYTETKPLNQQFNVNTSYQDTLTLAAGDEIYIYGYLDTQFFIGYPTSTINYRGYTFDGILVLKTIVEIDAATLYQETNCKTVLLHEAVERCIQYYTGQQVCFYSKLLGRTDLGYDEDGKAGIIGWTNGWWLRDIEDKKLFVSLDEIIKFLNNRFCIGYGFETVNDDGELVGTGDTGLPPGTQVFRIEERSHFFNKDVRILSLGKVYQPKKSLISKYYYNEFIHGYTEKIDVKQLNAIDEFNTIRKTNVPITNTKNKLDVSCGTITGGYQIESQRRLSFSSEDGNLDDKNFAVTLIRDAGEDSGYRTRKGSDGYVLLSFENIYDPESGYNYYLSPGRCRIAWEKFLASGLIRSTRKILKFNSGEVNYTMKSQDDNESEIVEEDGNSDLTNIEPDFDPELYKLFDVPFSIAQQELLEDNPYGYFEFEDKFDNIMSGFLNDGNGISINPNLETADFELLKVYRP